MPLLAFLFLCFCRSGNLPDMAKAGSVHEYLIELHEKYGEIVSFWWGKEYMSVYHQLITGKKYNQSLTSLVRQIK